MSEVKLVLFWNAYVSLKRTEFEAQRGELVCLRSHRDPEAATYWFSAIAAGLSPCMTFVSSVISPVSRALISCNYITSGQREVQELPCLVHFPHTDCLFVHVGCPPLWHSCPGFTPPCCSLFREPTILPSPQQSWSHPCGSGLLSLILVSDFSVSLKLDPPALSNFLPTLSVLFVPLSLSFSFRISPLLLFSIPQNIQTYIQS